MEALIQEQSDTGIPCHYLEALHLAELPVDQIVLQAELLGLPPFEIRRIAGRLLANDQGKESRLPALCLLLSVCKQWKPYLAEGHALGLELIEPLLASDCVDLAPLEQILGAKRFLRFRTLILRRLGYPLALSVCPANRVPWIEGDKGFMAAELELRGFESQVKEWRHLQVPPSQSRIGS